MNRLWPALLFLVPILLLLGCDSGGEDDDSLEVTVERVGHLDPAAAPFTNSDVWGYVDPDTGTEYALIGGFGQDAPGLYIIDVSNPANPTLTSTVMEVPGFDVKVWQNYAYTVTGSGDAPDAPQGRIIDLSDPANPQVVGEFPSSHNIFIDERGLMYSEFPGLRIFDLRDDPTNPTLLWNDGVPADGHDATVVGDRLYDFHGTSGTRIYDVSDPANPLQLGEITFPQIRYHHSGWPTKDGRFLYVCDELANGETPDITVWDISRPDTPEMVAAITDTAATVHNLAIIDDLAYVSHYAAGFRVYDVSDPANPILAAEFDTEPDFAQEGFFGAWGVYPFAPSGNIYVSDRSNGLSVFSVRQR